MNAGSTEILGRRGSCAAHGAADARGGGGANQRLQLVDARRRDACPIKLVAAFQRGLCRRRGPPRTERKVYDTVQTPQWAFGMKERLGVGRPRAGMLAVLTALATLCQPSSGRDPASLGPVAKTASGSPVDLSGRDDAQAQLATRDPLAFLRLCRQRSQSINDYRCRFLRQELVQGSLTAEQETQVAFRQEPFSVDMRWVRNADRARRVSYVAGRWSREGREFALVEPAGFLSLLVPSGVKRDIHAGEMAASSRRSIDQFGFRNTLDLIIKFCELAKADPAFELRYVGLAMFGDRPSYVLERRLPASPIDQPFPDRILVIYIDREWLVPTGCFAYADDARRQLLGSYVSRSVEFNVGLTDADF